MMVAKGCLQDFDRHPEKAGMEIGKAAGERLRQPLGVPALIFKAILGRRAAAPTLAQPCSSELRPGNVHRRQRQAA